MNRKWTRLASIPALALSLVLWSCDSLSEPGDALLGPGASAGPLHSSGGGFTVVKQKDLSTGAVTAVVDENGGKLVLGKHELWIPRGAVSGPTTFTMTKVDAANVTVDLTATRLLLNDVGSQGFAQPLTLKLSYENTEVVDPAPLKIIWMKPDGSQEVQSTEVDLQGKRAVAPLDHFSRYALAYP